MNEELRKALAELEADMRAETQRVKDCESVMTAYGDVDWTPPETTDAWADTLKALLERPQGEAVAWTASRVWAELLPSTDHVQSEDMARLLAALNAAAQPQAKVPEWRPIETAPKDGEHILLYSPERGAFRGFYITDDDGYKPGWKGCYMMQGLFRDEIGGRKLKGAAVTNWMPLPAAPEPPAVAAEKGPEVVYIGDSLTKAELYAPNDKTTWLRGDGVVTAGLNDPTGDPPSYLAPLLESHWSIYCAGQIVVRILKDGTVDIAKDATPEQLRTAIEIMAEKIGPPEFPHDGQIRRALHPGGVTKLEQCIDGAWREIPVEIIDK